MSITPDEHTVKKKKRYANNLCGICNDQAEYGYSIVASDHDVVRTFWTCRKHAEITKLHRAVEQGLFSADTRLDTPIVDQLFKLKGNDNTEQAIELLTKSLREKNSGTPLADYFANSDLAKAIVEDLFRFFGSVYGFRLVYNSMSFPLAVDI